MTRQRSAAALAVMVIGLAASSAWPAGQFPSLTPDQVAEWQERGEVFLLIDTRPTAIFDLKHARGAMGIPAFSTASRPLPRAARIVLYDGGAGSTDALEAARALQAKGHPEFYILEGGLTAWEARGLPIVVEPGSAKAPLVEPIAAEALMRLIEGGERVVILDIRLADAYRQSRVPGARPASADALLEQGVAALSPSDLIVLVDEGEGPARAKAEALRRRGFLAVKYLHGGMPMWRDRMLRVDR